VTATDVRSQLYPLEGLFTASAKVKAAWKAAGNSSRVASVAQPLAPDNSGDSSRDRRAQPGESVESAYHEALIAVVRAPDTGYERTMAAIDPSAFELTDSLCKREASVLNAFVELEACRNSKRQEAPPVV
jgi:hypothetical protein